MSMENLPYDVLSEILIRLRAKQLARLRCLSKSWNALLSESSFIKSHLDRSIHTNKEVLWLFSQGFSRCSSIKARSTSNPDLNLVNFIQVPASTQFKYRYGYGRVIGSVNGLICFYYKSYTSYSVHIWNPSLSLVLTLPKCPLMVSDYMDYHFRFGYDPKTDDYKVVRFTSYPRPPNMLPEVEVYSMRKGSWELTTQKFPSHIKMIVDEDHVCADGHDGHLHGLGSLGLEWKPETILAFDLGAETFSEIPLPDSILHRHYISVGVLGGKLCVMESIVIHGNYEVWVMDEYGVADSWVKHHVFLPFIGYTYPHGFTSHNELIFSGIHFGMSCLYLYDPIAAQIKSFNMAGGRGHYKIVKYVDSLVWVAPAEQEPPKRHLLISFLNSHRLLKKGLQKTTKAISRFLFRGGICCNKR